MTSHTGTDEGDTNCHLESLIVSKIARRKAIRSN